MPKRWLLLLLLAACGAPQPGPDTVYLPRRPAVVECGIAVDSLEIYRQADYYQHFFRLFPKDYACFTRIYGTSDSAYEAALYTFSQVHPGYLFMRRPSDSLVAVCYRILTGGPWNDGSIEALRQHMEHYCTNEYNGVKLLPLLQRHSADENRRFFAVMFSNPDTYPGREEPLYYALLKQTADDPAIQQLVNNAHYERQQRLKAEGKDTTATP